MYKCKHAHKIGGHFQKTTPKYNAVADHICVYLCVKREKGTYITEVIWQPIYTQNNQQNGFFCSFFTALLARALQKEIQ